MTQIKFMEENEEAAEPPGRGAFFDTSNKFWWQRADLRYDEKGTLVFADVPLSSFASNSPIYVYNLQRIREKISLLRNAVPEARILYAVKANRHPEILSVMREKTDGIDVCSPNEALLALKHGFKPEQISYTGTSISESDLTFLGNNPNIHVNTDSLSQLRRLTILDKKRPNRSIGVRINPEQGIGYRNEKRLVYAQSQRPTKFGLLEEQIPDAIRIAKDGGCEIETVHWHIGCGWLAPQLPELEQILVKTAAMTEKFPSAKRVNLGGGLGVPFQKDDTLLPLDVWAKIVQRTIGNRWQITLEPGSFLVQDAGILLAQVNTVEQKRNWIFAGVNAGFNLLMEPLFYGMPCESVYLQLPERERPIAEITIAGNINEAHDLLMEDIVMPIPREGEWLGFLNAGAYAAAMSSNHCLRGDFIEAVIS